MLKSFSTYPNLLPQNLQSDSLPFWIWFCNVHNAMSGLFKLSFLKKKKVTGYASRNLSFMFWFRKRTICSKNDATTNNKLKINVQAKLPQQNNQVTKSA